jgi:hypothetical protein
LCLPGGQAPRFYNAGMSLHPVFPRLLALLGSLAASLALAQQAPPRETAEPAGKGPDQVIERIRHEDAGSRIDELRVGGETKAITVQPKGNAPAYEVAPDSNNRNPASTDGGSEGKPRWNILKY